MLNKAALITLIICSLSVPAVHAQDSLNFSRMAAEGAMGTGLGFVGGMVTMGVWMALAGGDDTRLMNSADYLNSYLLGSMASSALGVYYVGRFGRDEGNYLWTLAGSCGATIMGYLFGMGKDNSFALFAMLVPVLQSAGGVVGFNFPRIRKALVSGSKKEGVKTGIPEVKLLKNERIGKYLIAEVKLLEIQF